MIAFVKQAVQKDLLYIRHIELSLVEINVRLLIPVACLFVCYMNNCTLDMVLR